MNLAGKKNSIHRRKKIFTDENLRKRQKEHYTQLSFPICLCTTFYTKGMVYSSVKPKAVTSGREVDNNWA